MEIRHERYKELVRAEITLKMIYDFLGVERGELSDTDVLSHIAWLIEVHEEQKEENK